MEAFEKYKTVRRFCYVLVAVFAYYVSIPVLMVLAEKLL